MAPKRGRRGRAAPMADINVTPMVDVMLVLLIIFMVAAPLLAQGVPVQLPGADGKPLPREDKPLAVSVDAGGRVFIGHDPVAPGTLPGRLAAMPDHAGTQVELRADRAVTYDKVMAVMGALSAAGYTRIALVSVPDK